MSHIPQVEWIWKDGSFIPWDEAKVHILSHSVQFGSSAFEGIRCYSTPGGPAVFRLKEHLRRLYDTCKVYRMELPISQAAYAAACCELLERNGLESGYLRPMIVRGYGSIGMAPVGAPTEMYAVCWPWGSYLGDEALEGGVDVCISTWFRPAPNTYPAMAKIAGNYLGSTLSKMEALANGFAESIALTPDGLVSEGTGQNVFMVRDGMLATPPIDGTMLPGITRDSVIRIAEDLGIPFREQPIPREMLYMADELFFSGTASEITPIRSVDRIVVGAGARGPLTKQIQERFLAIARGAFPDTHGWLTQVRQAAASV